MNEWSYALAIVGLSGAYLAGKKLRIGWAVGIASQVMWAAYGLCTRQYGFVISAFFYSAVYYRNFVEWSRERV